MSKKQWRPLLVNIRGTNGSGKSTIPMFMMTDPHMIVVPLGKGKHGQPANPRITVFPSYDCVALGTYFNKTGGMDTFKNMEQTRVALRYAWETYPEYDIIMEGIICSTVKSTYADLFDEYTALVKMGDVCERKIIVMNLLPPPEVCIQRVYKRNGGKPIDESQVISKWNTVNRNVQYFRDRGYTSLKISNGKTKRETILSKFFAVCDKYRMEDEV